MVFIKAKIMYRVYLVDIRKVCSVVLHIANFVSRPVRYTLQTVNSCGLELPSVTAVELQIETSSGKYS